jgi:glycosyltransferase involved in cell wall biosynthesis
MNRIKICFVTREYAHDKMGGTGGIGVFIKQFTQQLSEHEFDIVVYSFGVNPVRFKDGSVEIVKIRDLSRMIESIKSFLRRIKIPGYITAKIILEYFNRLYISFRLSLFCWKRKFNLIEFHDYGGDTPFFIGKLPKVIRCHGSAVTLHEFMGYTKRITDIVFEKRMFKRFSKHIIAVSEYSARITKKAFELKALPSVIYNSVTLPKPKYINNKLYLAEPTIINSIFYFGSLRERKGIDIACRIFNAVIKEFPKASFHVLGNNNNDYWNKEAKKILSPDALERTTYYGAITNEQIFEYLQKAHVVLFPSYGENFSIALLETMSIGKVSIVSKIPAFEEIIVDGFNGYISDDVESYKDIVFQIFNKKHDIELISKNAMNTVNDVFNSNKIIAQNIEFYKSLL